MNLKYVIVFIVIALVLNLLVWGSLAWAYSVGGFVGIAIAGAVWGVISAIALGLGFYLLSGSHKWR